MVLRSGTHLHLPLLIFHATLSKGLIELESFYHLLQSLADCKGRYQASSYSTAPALSLAISLASLCSYFTIASIILSAVYKGFVRCAATSSPGGSVIELSISDDDADECAKLGKSCVSRSVFCAHLPL